MVFPCSQTPRAEDESGDLFVCSNLSRIKWDFDYDLAAVGRGRQLEPVLGELSGMLKVVRKGQDSANIDAASNLCGLGFGIEPTVAGLWHCAKKH